MVRKVSVSYHGSTEEEALISAWREEGEGRFPWFLTRLVIRITWGVFWHTHTYLILRDWNGSDFRIFRKLFWIILLPTAAMHHCKVMGNLWGFKQGSDGLRVCFRKFTLMAVCGGWERPEVERQASRLMEARGKRMRALTWICDPEQQCSLSFGKLLANGGLSNKDT